MAHSQHTTIPREFKHLTLDQRGMIAAYHDTGLSSREIGEKVGCDHTTVSRELRRGRVLQRNSNLTERCEYFPDAGQKAARNIITRNILISVNSLASMIFNPLADILPRTLPRSYAYPQLN